MQSVLFGQTGAIELLRKIGRPATVSELYTFMRENYPPECCMTQMMISFGLKKAANWQECHREKDVWHIGPAKTKPFKI
jgi:hypothetical protein